MGYTKWGFPQQRSQTPNFLCQAPNKSCQTPNTVCQTPNKSCQTPRISKPNTQNPVAFFPKFRSKSPTSWATLPAVWSSRGAPPATDRTLAIVNLRKFGAPSAKFPQIVNLQWSVCLRAGRQSFCDWHFEVIVPQAPQSLQNADLQWSGCLHVAQSGLSLIHI